MLLSSHCGNLKSVGAVFSKYENKEQLWHYDLYLLMLVSVSSIPTHPDPWATVDAPVL